MYFRIYIKEYLFLKFLAISEFTYLAFQEKIFTKKKNYPPLINLFFNAIINQHRNYRRYSVTKSSL